MNDNLLCDICNTPFFTDDDAAISNEPCHFGRSEGYYCGLCYSFLLAMKNNGVPTTAMRYELLMKYIRFLQEKLPEKGKLTSEGNVVDAKELFREDYNGID